MNGEKRLLKRVNLLIKYITRNLLIVQYIHPNLPINLLNSKGFLPLIFNIFSGVS